MRRKIKRRHSNAPPIAPQNDAAAESGNSDIVEIPEHEPEPEIIAEEPAAEVIENRPDEQPKASPDTSWTKLAITALFFLSGFTSLIYQVNWSRQLSLIIGSTTTATATVLAVFMAGLALGAYISGRMAARVRNPVFTYGVLELVIGLWALLVGPALKAATPIYQFAYQQFNESDAAMIICRAILTSLLLIVPTTCMGATLPILARFVTESLDKVGNRVGFLYSANTLGAVFGACLGGFLLLPWLGINGATLTAALLNFALFGVARHLSQGTAAIEFEVPAGSSRSGDAPSKLPLETVILTLCFACSGAIAMAFEVAFTRALSLIIGSTTYAFSIMLSVFLIGLFGGSAIAARLVDKRDCALTLLIVAHLGIFFCAMAILFSFNYLPWWNLSLALWLKNSSPVFVLSRLLMAGAVLLPIALFFGVTFPSVVKLCARDLEALGRSVGSLYAANTTGAILGAVLAGFVLVPWLGLERTLVCLTVSSLVIGLFLMAKLAKFPIAVKAGGLCVGTVATAVLLFASPNIWDYRNILMAQPQRRLLMTTMSPPTTYRDWIGQVHTYSLDYYKDGATSNVGVVGSQGKHSLLTNGHVDGSDKGDMPTQVVLAADPLLLKPNAKKVAIIGWGTGATAGVCTQFPVQSIDAIELEPAVVEASRVFNHVNYQPLKDPRVKLHYTDGRNFLLGTKQKFDVIVSEPSNPWQAGVCNLFTKEYFEICRQRLAPGGVLSLWMQTNEVPTENLSGVLLALKQVFPHVVLLRDEKRDLTILASEERIDIDLPQCLKTFAQPNVRNVYASIGIFSFPAWVARLQSTPDSLDKALLGAEPNVDDTNKLEYAVALQYELKDFLYANDKFLSHCFENRHRILGWDKASERTKAEFLAAVSIASTNSRMFYDGWRWSHESIGIAETANGRAAEALALLHDGKTQQAEQSATLGLKLDPKSLPCLDVRMRARIKNGNWKEAKQDLYSLVAYEPDKRVARFNLALISFMHGSAETPPQKILDCIQPLLSDTEFCKRYCEIYYVAAAAQKALGNKGEAARLLDQYLLLQPNSQKALLLLAEVRKQ